MKLTLRSYENFVNKSTEGGQMLLNPNDQYISQTLINTGKWEEYLYPVFKQYIHEGDCVLDLGANVGCHSLLFSRLAGENGSVHCFEPFPDLYFQLSHNLLINRCYNTTTYCQGLSNESSTTYVGKIDLTVRNNFGAGKIYEGKPDMTDIHGLKIDIITIDSLNLTPNFIKIDVEDMEDKVLLGSKETIQKYKPTILVEIHQDDLPKVTKVLDSLDYNIVEKYHPWDYLALPKNK